MTEFGASSSSSSSSSPFTYRWPYHVFLSFRGEDTRDGFTGNLYYALRERGIRTFIDDQGIRKGEEITPTLLKTIKESKTAIVVFSEDYASSTFCLTELVQILDCMKEHNGRFIWPVFYHVNPSNVRHQKETYKNAFDRYEGVKDEKTVKRWKFALKEVANLSGWHVESKSRVQNHGKEPIIPFNYVLERNLADMPPDEAAKYCEENKVQRSKSYEYEIIEEIIEAVSKEISIGLLHIAQFPVGLESQVEEVCSLLNKQPHCDGATIVGIFGLGGIGKTTIARSLYNEIASDFKHKCFLNNIKGKPIHDLQKRLLSETVKGTYIDLKDYRAGIPIIKDMLCSKKILLILDDIDTLEQLWALAGEPNWFGFGSIIIITTRDKNLLEKHEVKRIYEAKELDDGEARKLLILHAFKTEEVDPKYKEVINRALKYAKGLPLALEILGSNLGTGHSIKEWETALDIYEKIPEKTIQKVLKASYDGLEETQREIFLDIACFYKALPSKYSTEMLSTSHGVGSEFCIRVLIDKSLIKINEYGQFDMHDLIQDMGMEIVRMESTLEAGGRSRLWLFEDISHVLQGNTGTSKIQAIKLWSPSSWSTEKVEWSGEAFKEMKNLREISFYHLRSSQGPKCLPNSLRVLEWHDYPSSTLPDSRLETMGKPFQNFYNLCKLDLRGSRKLKELPDISNAANLEDLNVSCCKKLTKIDDSVGHLTKLRVLDAHLCRSLDTFIVGGIKLVSLEMLNLSFCEKLHTFPKILVRMKKIKTLDLRCTVIETLPESIKKFVTLEALYLSTCRELPQLPNIKVFSIQDYRSLTSCYTRLLLTQNFYYLHELDIQRSENLEEVPDISKAVNLEVLNVSYCGKLTKIDDSVGHLTKLKVLDAKGCNRLDTFIVGGIKLVSLEILNLSCCSKLHTFPEILVTIEKIKTLDLCCTAIKTLPQSIEKLVALEALYLRNCKDICQLPNLAYRNLKTLDLDGCVCLQEIRGNLSNLKVFSARDCTSLTSCFTRLLLTEELHETGNTNFILPGKEIPKWFHKHSIGSSVSFWVHKKFPQIALCAVLTGSPFTEGSVSFVLRINDTLEYVFGNEILPQNETDYILLFDLRSHDMNFNMIRNYLEEELNHVEFSWERPGVMESGHQFVKCFGIYFYNYDICMEDILFENPIPQKIIPVEGVHKICESNSESSSVYYDNSRDCRASNEEDDKSKNEIVALSTEVVSTIKKEEKKWMLDVVDSSSFSTSLGYSSDNSSTLEDQSTINDRGDDEMGSRKTRITCFDLFSCLGSLCSSSTAP